MKISDYLTRLTPVIGATAAAFMLVAAALVSVLDAATTALIA